MAYSLCLELRGEKYYIHRAYSHNPDSPKTTNNQNYAYLFASEPGALKFREANAIPEDYLVKFIVMRMPKEKLVTEKKINGYKKLERGNMNESIPAFLR